uniref:CDK-activating kinase assembly factor MAT1 n=1 Tax=Corethrella appendiculata TaxID=1370023 RepID=U5EW86_9DIPT
MDDQVCPRCKTTKYRNPSLKLMINVCGHCLCESCVELLFLKGSGSCPECNVPLRRSNFRIQMFEDPKVEKEVNIRQRVIRDFNKREEDFASLAEYNDYLEMIEEIIYNLANNIDTTNTNKRIDQYKKENREITTKNKAKLSRDEYELEQIIEMEKEMNEQRRQELLLLEQENRKKKHKNKEELIDSLIASHEDASKIVDKYAQKAEEECQITLPKPPPPPQPKQTQFSTGIKFSHQSGFSAIPKSEEGPLYTYETPVFKFDGPMAPSLMEIEKNGYMTYMRSENGMERAGGFKTNISCMRAIQEALIGLYYGC